jgi:hypothetical protein
MTFTCVLTMYLNKIHPLHHSPSSSLPLSQDNFNRFHCSIFIHVQKVHQPDSPSFTLSAYPLSSHWYPLLTGPVLPSCPLFINFLNLYFF